ncbi:mitochondrial carrier domain-containing protein [Pelagophyceae sp. CCMP2097]|nr:mitochondrial carrier domain-containing protein [Pelagophyceae sp. CCMP2097]|mmetsp:Transcript_22313/g.75443  ORF Transcript_22313/g.75443 Transcript_22313/m.75443 type:complete len:520 (+) Transcript_22313:119-1678(+)
MSSQPPQPSTLGLSSQAGNVLERARGIAVERSHRAVEPGDLLLALALAADDGLGVEYLASKKDVAAPEEVPEEAAVGAYSDNALIILASAKWRAADKGKSIVGTEDILWALFSSSHSMSRSSAVKQLEDRGVNFDMVFGKAKLSPEARLAFKEAIEHANSTGADGAAKVVGAEDLLWALFRHAPPDSRAANWVTSQHIRSWPRNAVEDDGEDDASAAAAAENEPEGRQRSGSAASGAASQTLARLFVIGGIAGTLETVVQQPLVFLKTMAQVDPHFGFGRALRQPSLLFRGVAVNALSIGPISAVQLAAHGGIDALLRRNVSEKTADHITTKIVASALAGVVSCLVVTPAEVVMVAQQTTGQSFAAVVRDLWRLHGGLPTFFRGNVATVAREAAWTCGFFGVTPYIKQALQEDSKYFRQHEVAAAACASIVAGQLAASLSQPADVVASLMKEDTGITGRARRFRGVVDASQHLYAQSGFGGFFRGLGARSVRCCGAVFIMGETQTALQTLMDTNGVLMA